MLGLERVTEADAAVPGRREAETSPAAREAVPVRHRGRWVAAGLIALLVAVAIRSVVTNENFEWPVVGSYLFSDLILDGVKLTLLLTVVAMTLAIATGVVVAMMRLSPNPIVSGFAHAFLWFFRGVPLLVQLIFWYNLAALYPSIEVTLPFGPTLVDAQVNTLITTFVAALLGLGLNGAAYMAAH